MMKTFKSIMYIAAAAMAFTACNVEPIEAPEETVGTHTVTFVASQLDTKTTMDINNGIASFDWEEADVNYFHIFENEYSNKATDYAADIDENGAMQLMATFENGGTAPFTYFGFFAPTFFTYPTVPSTQTDNGKYDPKADILIAKPVTADASQSEEILSFQFKRIVAINVMTLKGLTAGETVSEVKIVSDKPIAGKYDYVNEQWYNSTDMQITVSANSVVDENGNAVIYFVSAPVEEAQLTITATTVAGKTYSKQLAKTITFSEGGVKTFGVTVEESIPEPETIEINATNSGVTGSYADGTFDVGDVTFGFTQWMKNTFIQAKASQAKSLYNVDPIPGKITKITFVTGTGKTPRAIKVYGVDSSETNTEIPAPMTDMTMVFDFSGKDYNSFLMSTPGNACYFEKIIIEYVAGPAKNLTSIAVSGTPTKTSYNVGDAFDPAGLVVTATYDDNSTADVTASAEWAINPNPLTAETTSVSVVATVGEISSTAYNVNVTVSEVVEKEFALYVDALVEGDYIIYYEGNALKNTVSSNRLGYGTVSPDNNVISTSDESIIWHIAKSGEYWTIYNASVEKYAAGTATKNQGALIDEISDLAMWTCTNDNGKYDFINKGRASASSDSANKYLRNNGTYGFACYTSSTGGALSLYKKDYIYTFVKVESVSIDETLNLEVGEKHTLVANVLPENASNKSVTWESSDGDVATVENGVVTAIAAGETTITVTTVDGRFTASCDVTVNAVTAKVYGSLAELVAAGEPTEYGKPVTVTLTNEVIESIYITKAGVRSGVYLKASNQEIEIFCNDVPSDWEAFGKLSGTLENCTWKKYYSTWELCPEDWDELDYTAPVKYNVVVPTGLVGGTITANPIEAAAGATVTLTATPAAGYQFVSWSVKDESNNDITVTNNAFTMPASNVTVGATFNQDAGETVVTVPFNYPTIYNSITGSQTEDLDNVTNTIDNVSITYHKVSGSNAPKYYANGSQLRIYNESTITVEAPSGKKITEIAAVGTTTWAATKMAGDTGSVSDQAKKWTGSASKVVLTITGSFRFTELDVTYK